MRRVLASVSVLMGLGLVAIGPASCAQGDESSAAGAAGVTDPTSPADPCGACPPGEKCSGGACEPLTTDADGDGVALSLDCDDHDPAIHPGAIETCNGKDDNCDGKIDEGFDLDGDRVPSCAIAGKPADCDDKDPSVHPGATEICNGKDDNCDGTIDDGFDRDNDGFFACAHGTTAADCDDTNALIHPGANEICNGKDDNCDGKLDELPASLVGSLNAPANAHWKLSGSTLLANGWAQLTQDVGGQAGALWWNGSYTFDTFDVSATFWIQAKPTGADGLAFAWVAGNDLDAVGYGSFYGAGGLPGYAVGIDTFQNAGDPPTVPFLVLLDAAKPDPPLGRYPLPNVRDATNHRLRVALDAGKVSVWLDNVNYLTNFALPNPTPIIGHWGFTAGTGGFSEAHWVTDVTMSFPNGQGCVP